MAKTVKEAKADVFLRDTDSQSLFNNSGVLSFRYYHEWNDCYNPATDETVQINGEVYDETTNSYKPNCPEGFSPVFNGRLSALWDNIVNCFPNEVGAMYVKMRGNGLTYQDMLTKYKDFWKYWCENLYNADAFGYANTNNFTKAYGDKVQVMDYFYGKRQRYLDSKYHCGSSIGNNLRLRLYEVGRGFAIKHYQAIYCTLQWGAGNFDDYRNIKPGTYSYMPFKASSPQDVTFDIDDADLITELSTYVKGSDGNYTIYGLEGLGDFKFDLNMDLLKRLTKFVMNYTASKPNTREAGLNFDLSKMGMLRQVIVRNVKNLKKSIVLSSDLLEEIDFTNTPITGVTTPPTDMLTKLVLPDTIKELNLVGYTNLQVSGLQVAGYSNIETLHIEDCPNLDSYEIAKACYEAGAKLSNTTLKGINWENANVDLLLVLAKNDAIIRGKITLDAVSAKSVLALKDAFGDIDSENNSLYISYTKFPIQKVTILGETDYITEIGKYVYDFNVIPITGNNISSISWSINENEFATIGEKSGILSVKKLGTEDNNDKVTITISVSLIDGKVLTASKEIPLYEPAAQLGDIVFSDGTYGTKLKDNVTPIGVCIYIDPTNKKRRLMMALNNIGLNCWGLYQPDFTGLSLKDSTIPIFNIKDIIDVNTLKNATFSDMYDDTTGTFYTYNSNINLGNLGFRLISATAYNSLKDYLEDIGIKSNSYIDIGQLDTLYIIQHRDTILSDSNIAKEIPTKSSTWSEKERLEYLINNIILTEGDAKYAQYYYPIASYAYAYEPNVQNLNDKFKAHHWFLPSSGLLARISYYHQRGYENGFDAIFSNAVRLGVLKNTKLNFFYASSSERIDDKAYCGYNLSSGNSGMGYENRYVYKNLNNVYILPVCAF